MEIFTETGQVPEVETGQVPAEQTAQISDAAAEKKLMF